MKIASIIPIITFVMGQLTSFTLFMYPLKPFLKIYLITVLKVKMDFQKNTLYYTKLLNWIIFQADSFYIIGIRTVDPSNFLHLNSTLPGVYPYILMYLSSVLCFVKFFQVEYLRLFHLFVTVVQLEVPCSLL